MPYTVASQEMAPVVFINVGMSNDVKYYREFKEEGLWIL